MAYSSLFVLAPRNPLRTWLNNMQQHSTFETAILVLIAASSLILALDSPTLPPQSTLARVITHADFTFTVAFAAEMLIKLLAKVWRACCPFLIN